jgi:hypothetical protein
MKMITQAELHRLITYDPFTGEMLYRVRAGSRKPGSTVGCATKRGYRRVVIAGILYSAQDLAWLYMTGKWPTGIVDHRDCNPSNFAWRNLRQASYSQNNQNRSLGKNNTSGIKGVSFFKPTNKWRATVEVNGRRVYLGHFVSREAAAATVKSARESLCGEFTNHGDGQPCH